MEPDVEQPKITVSSKITFKVFSNCLEQLHKIDESPNSNRAIPKNEEKRRLLTKFYDLWRSTAIKLAAAETLDISCVDGSYFPIIRMLLPSDDRRVYGLKESKLAKYLIEALCIAPKSDDALKLINYRFVFYING